MSAPPPAERTTTSRFLSSTLAAYGSQLARALIRAVSDIALARLIIPELHGTFDLGWSIVLVASLVRDAGLSHHLVRDRRQPYGTVLMWSLGAGVVMTALLVLGAPLAGRLEPGVPPVLRVLALYVLLDAAAVVPRVFFERRLEIGRLVLPEVARGAMVATLSLTLAGLDAGVWSFVAGELAGAALFALLLWRRAHGRIPLTYDPALLPDLLRHSRYLFLIGVAAYSLPHLERFVLATFVDAGLLGQYGKARLWALRLQAMVLPAVARALYPALVEYAGDRQRFIGAYRIGTVTILAMEVLAAYFLYFNAEIVMLRLLAGPQWGASVPLLQILCFLPLADPFSRLGGELLKVKNDDRAWLAVVLLNSASLIVFGLLLTSRLGAPGMAWANFLLLGNLVMAWRVYRICGREILPLLRDLAFLYLLPLPFFAALAWLLPPGWGRLATSVALSALLGLVVAWRFYRPFRAFFVERDV